MDNSALTSGRLQRTYHNADWQPPLVNGSVVDSTFKTVLEQAGKVCQYRPSSAQSSNLGQRHKSTGLTLSDVRPSAQGCVNFKAKIERQSPVPSFVPVECDLQTLCLEVVLRQRIVYYTVQ